MPQSLKQILDSLGEEDRRKLMYGFEHGFFQYVKLPDGKCISVNAKDVPNWTSEVEAGSWALGTFPQKSG